MIDFSLFDGLAILAGSSVSILFWVWFGDREQSTAGSYQRPPAPRDVSRRQPLILEFNLEGHLLRGNTGGQSFLERLSLDVAHWSALRSRLLSRFPDLPGAISPSTKPHFREHLPCHPSDPAELGIEHHENGMTLYLDLHPGDAPEMQAHMHYVYSNIAHLDVIRAASEQAPHPVWQTNASGGVDWANAAYRTLDGLITRHASAPNAPLFDLPEQAPAQGPHRLSIQDRDRNRTYWFDVISQPCGDGALHFATDVHAVVNAEAAQRNFVQTLAKTFAHLPTGLAIFDRNRQLALFNPALIDLTELPADFLSARPNLFSFFDQLRNNQIMPEPKNYASWRDRIAEIVTAAIDDKFSETWTLHTGQTYRVTGRPHPDGALAFLIEDISAEISLTRKFRADMEITCAAIDALEGEFAVFGANGELLHSNAALRRDLLGDAENQPVTVHQMTRLWQSRTRPSPIWGEVRDFVYSTQDRRVWSKDVALRNGHLQKVTATPLAQGASLIRLLRRDERQASKSALGKARKSAAA